MIKQLLSLVLVLTASVLHVQAQTSDPRKESLVFCDEGSWQQDDGQLSFYDGDAHTLTAAGCLRKLVEHYPVHPPRRQGMRSH